VTLFMVSPSTEHVVTRPWMQAALHAGPINSLSR
jgi:hypothetical protein